MQALCFHITPQVPVMDDDDATLGALILRWTAWWANWPHPVRLFADLVPQRYPAQVAHVERRLAVAARGWQQRWLVAQRTHLDDLHSEAQAMRLRQYVVTWVPDDLDGDAVQADLQRGLLVAATPTLLPHFWTHTPGEAAQHLSPASPGDPYMTVLMAHTIKGAWLPHSLTSLIHLDQRLTLMIDIDTPPTEGWQGTESKVQDLQQALARIAVRNPHDARAQQAHDQASEIGQALTREFLHHIRIAILIQTRTLAHMQTARQQIQAACRGFLALVACPWVQRRQLRLFSAVPRAAVHAPIPPAPVRSFGLAHATPVGLRRQARARGVLLGRDQTTGLQLHHDLLRPKENKHLVLLGPPKVGKTTALSALAVRLATAGARVILIEPLGKAALVRDMVENDHGCQYVEVARQCRINPLEPISDDLAVQYLKVRRSLELALGRLVAQGARHVVEPRPLDEYEDGVLQRAVEHPAVYGPHGARLRHLTTDSAPVLDDLLHALAVLEPDDALEAQARDRLAYTIHRRLLGTARHIYGQRSTIPTTFDRDVSLYTTRGLDPALAPLVYDHVFSAAMRLMYQPRPEPLMVLIDETYIMTMVQALEAWLIEGIKGGRNNETGIVLADQNIKIFFTEQGTPTAFGAFVLENTGVRLFFRQDGLAGELVERAYKGTIAQQHLERLRTLGQGEYLALFEDEVVHARLDLLPLEARYLA